MIKISELEIENLKRIKAVKIEPGTNGLTVIGGKNNQGKTSVLDSIAWALGGDKYKPSQPIREGSVVPPILNITLSNGLVVTRDGKNSSLKVIDTNGNKCGQQLLNEFVEQLAIDLPKFMEASSKEKANTLLKIIGVGDRLYELEQEETKLYNQRHAIGQIYEQKSKYAKEMIMHTDVPKELISISELIQQQQKILAINGENQRKRENLNHLKITAQNLTMQIDELVKRRDSVLKDLEIAEKSAENLADEATEELEQNIANIECINQKIRSNLDKEKAEIDAEDYKSKYDDLTGKIHDIRQVKESLLSNANLPLAGLSVSNGELIYNGFEWDNMSGSDQLKVATAIVRKLNPKCGFVLLDKLEQMDLDTMQEFGAWLEQEGLQAIATRVSTGKECSIIIEDGYIMQNEKKSWEVGEF